MFWFGIISLIAVIFTTVKGPILLMWLIFVVINGVLHFITDFYTSRLTSYFWSIGDRHNFFVVVGLDQLIHCFCIIITFFLFFM
jgi:hypothetical protein